MAFLSKFQALALKDMKAMKKEQQQMNLARKQKSWNIHSGL